MKYTGKTDDGDSFSVVRIRENIESTGTWARLWKENGI